MKAFNFTSIEQSRELARIGIKRTTADCSFRPYWYSKEEARYLYFENMPKWEGPAGGSGIDIPCWSLAALIDLLPAGSHVEKTRDGFLCYATFHQPFPGKTAVEACYKAVKWLAENNYPNKH